MTTPVRRTQALSPFDQGGHWYKGNVHVHSTRSDGDRTPEAVIQWYREQGYHFLAFTDHRRLGPFWGADDGFLVLSGVEVDGHDPQSGLYHLVALGLSRMPDIPWGEGVSMQRATDLLRAEQAMVFVAHPYWSGQLSADLLDLTGCFGLEVYNGGCEVDDAKGYSCVHWDDLLAADRRLFGLAVDDAHWRNGSKDAGLGWVWVRAEELTQPAVLRALEAGHFYASSGPEIHDVHLDSGSNRLTVRCSPVAWVDFVGNAWLSRRVSAPEGQTITEASHVLQPEQTYVRVACRDSQGGWAWSQPYFRDQWR